MTRSDQTRRQFLATLGATAAAVSLPSISLSSPDHVSALVDGEFGWLGFSALDAAVSHSRDRYSFHVPYREDDREAVEDWIDAHDDRAELAWNEAIRTATVIMPPSHVSEAVSTSWFDSSRLVDQNIEMTIPDPVDDHDREDDFGSLSTMESLLMRSWARADAPASDGVAFDDAPEGSIKDAREVTGADDDLVDSVDASEITVAVIDTGFNTADGRILGDDYEDRILDASKDFITDETVGDEGLDAIADGNGHGTHVASTILADPSSSDNDAYRGYLPDASLLVCRALDDDGGGSTADIARAVTHAADEGADLICMSLGSPFWSVEVQEAIEYAVEEDAIPFVAAGNDRYATRWVNSPSDSPDTICIAAGTIEDPEDAETAFFSNIGPDPGTTNDSAGETADAGPHLAAPGMELTALVADTSGRLDEETLSGTSMATPCAVGVAGLVLADTHVDPGVLDEHLTDFAARTPNIGTTECGNGYPNAERAIDEDDDEDTQADARTSDAEARDASHEALSDLYGGAITRRLL